jgi:hypothetical protein
MKAEVEVEVVQRQDVVNMIADINDVFRRVEEEGIDQNGYDSNEYIVFKQIRKNIIKAINVHMNDMDKE